LRKSDKLKGYQIPGADEKLIVNLFADDTTVFLSAEDKFSDLQDILAKWCSASTAKFNIPKTEIIPIGTPAYRQEVLTTRRTTLDNDLIPENLHIAADGEATRILGTWVGNRVNAGAVWAPILEKIDTKLEQWEKGH
ncbi:hypothetical protein CPC08DRAFT_611588, partial [Agrocybe pediades]